MDLLLILYTYALIVSLIAAAPLIALHHPKPFHLFFWVLTRPFWALLWGIEQVGGASSGLAKKWKNKL